MTSNNEMTLLSLHILQKPTETPKKIHMRKAETCMSNSQATQTLNN